nr:PHD finger protein ALFIN-LIKE 4-like [Tanacetum cinerariifolium]
MINDLPTIFEVVSGIAKNSQKEKNAVSNHSSTKSKSNSKVQPPSPPAMKDDYDDDGLDDEDDDEHGETLCGSCGESYASDEFWICCDICERWFH